MNVDIKEKRKKKNQKNLRYKNTFKIYKIPRKNLYFRGINFLILY